MPDLDHPADAVAAAAAAVGTTAGTGTGQSTVPGVIGTFLTQVERRGTAPALRRWDGTAYAPLSWRDYGTLVEEAAAGLVGLGVARGDRVAILAGNRVEWHVADLAVLSIGAITVPVYATSSPNQVAHLLGHSGAVAIVVAGHALHGVVCEVLSQLPALRHVVVLDGALGEVDADTGCDDAATAVASTRTFDDLLAEGRRRLAAEPDLVRDRRAAIDLEDVATIVYTSGTTGEPKGAELTHRNLAATVEAIAAVVPIGPDDRFFSFLPLSHIAERIVSHFGQIHFGGETWFARSFASAADDLQHCRPTIFFAVPRVWEKARAGVEEKLADAPAPLRRLAAAYVALGRRLVRAEQTGGSVPAWVRALHGALDRVVGRKVRHGLGLDHARFVVSGAAPIHTDLLEWFHAVGLPIAEVYGQTEDCGPATLNPPGAIRIGTVGRGIPGVEIAIGVDEEILVRGATVCRGYYRNADATRELIDDDGWMHTGDLGRLDGDGYLTITGRKKDLIVTAHGKNVAPQHIETLLRTIPFVSQAVAIGDGRPFITALLTLDPDAVVPWARARGKTAAPEALASDSELLAELRRGVDSVNAQLNGVEQVKRWRVLPRDLTLADGELTPTLKVKRNVVLEHQRDVVEALYADHR
jgi:long-chain acyl-CoA synthetase